jgi:hypothetical protein
VPAVVIPTVNTEPLTLVEHMFDDGSGPGSAFRTAGYRRVVSSTPDTTPDVSEVAPQDAPDESALPAGAEVEASAVDVREVATGSVRHAPRFKNFLWVGAIIGLVLGGAAGFSVLSDPGARGLQKSGDLFTVFLAGGVAVGLLVAGFIAVLADRHSVRHRS